jgi:hypothetical protein
MSLLAAEACFLLLAALAARGNRSAYVAYVVLGLLFMPAAAGFRFNPQPCEVDLSLPLAIHSLTNYGHIWRFAIFFIATRGQFHRDDHSALVKAGAAAIAMGVVVEIEQALMGRGHCRVRDLIPDGVGVGAGALLVALWRRMASASRLRDSAP